MTTEQKNFIEKIAAAVNKYKDGYNIKVASLLSLRQSLIRLGRISACCKVQQLLWLEVW